MTKIINSQAILGTYAIKDIITAIDESYALLHQGKIVVPPRFFTDTVDGGDYLYGAATNLENGTYMVRSSAYMPWFSGVEGTRIVTGHYLYTSFKTGELLAVLNGNDIVNLRTGAKSAVAAKYLARQNSTTLGLIGLGQQARTQAEAIATQFPLKRIIGYSRDEQRSLPTRKYIREKTGLTVEYLPLADAVKQSDILVVGTFAKEPLVSFADLHPGQLVISLGHSGEVATDVVANADAVFVDYLESAKVETGPVKLALDAGISPEKITGDLGQLAAGKLPGRHSDDQIIYFQSLGVTHEDFATVEYLYRLLAETMPTVDLT